MKTIRLLALGLLVAALAAPARAADLGMTAPPLSISEWVKGKPVDLKAGVGKNIYVVEFWATWCPPCRVSIPHLSGMQQRFKSNNVVVIGISDENAAKVKPFVEKVGDTMDYVVALDDGQKTSAAYMGAFGVNGIPHAFVVDKAGKLVWHGHPMDRMDQVIEQVIDGKFDTQGAKKAAQVDQLFQQYFQGAVAGQPENELSEVANQIIGAKLPDKLHELSYIILNEPKVKTRQIDIALRAAQTAYDFGGPKDPRGPKDPALGQTYARALFESGKIPDAIQTAKVALKAGTMEPLRSSIEADLTRYENYAKATAQPKK